MNNNFINALFLIGSSIGIGFLAYWVLTAMWFLTEFSNKGFVDFICLPPTLLGIGLAVISIGLFIKGWILGNKEQKK